MAILGDYEGNRYYEYEIGKSCDSVHYFAS